MSLCTHRYNKILVHNYTWHLAYFSLFLLQISITLYSDLTFGVFSSLKTRILNQISFILCHNCRNGTYICIKSVVFFFWLFNQINDFYLPPSSPTNFPPILVIKNTLVIPVNLWRRFIDMEDEFSFLIHRYWWQPITNIVTDQRRWRLLNQNYVRYTRRSFSVSLLFELSY